ncbi:MAG: hypothetical protein HYY17_07555, partial [Planctomycetes bacterium]|nr:hypothetical protein [Planctomycetota bacterium]
MSVRDAILLHSGLVLYAAAAALLFAAVRRGSAPLLSAGRAGLLAAAAAHGSLFLLRGHFPPASLFEFALLLEVALTAVALAIDLAGKMPILSVGCAPTALAFGLVAALVGGPAGPRPEKVAGSSAALHVGVSLAAFGAFALAFVCGLLYLFERRQLKGRAAAPILGFMPSLEALYR